MRVQNLADAEVYRRPYGTLRLLCGATDGPMRTIKADLKHLQLRPGEATSHHFHLVRESIFHVLRGRVRIFSLRAHFDRVCEPGDTVIADPGDDHSLTNVGTEEATVIEIESPPHASSDKVPMDMPRKELVIPSRSLGGFWEPARMPLVKVCGVKNIETALECQKLGIAAVGIHAVGQKAEGKVLEDTDWMRVIPAGLSVFLLTDRTDPPALGELIAATNCDTVQLQGTHSTKDITRAAHFVRAHGRKLVRTVGVLPSTPFEQLRQEAHEADWLADAILFDSGHYGGTGKAHDWATTQAIGATLSKPFILAGGLNPDNCTAAIRQARPWGIDVESGVEDRFLSSDDRKVTAKNFSKIAALVNAARGAIDSYKA